LDKVDLSFVNASYCDRLKYRYNCSATQGVFLLSHDDPLVHADVKFFSASELVVLLRSLSNISVALCGKSSSKEPCAKDYMLAADVVMNDLMKTAKQTNISLILDGSFTDKCVGNRWQPLSMTWQGLSVLNVFFLFFFFCFFLHFFRAWMRHIALLLLLHAVLGMSQGDVPRVAAGDVLAGISLTESSPVALTESFTPVPMSPSAGPVNLGTG
jgi:hypothetical protein